VVYYMQVENFGGSRQGTDMLATSRVDGERSGGRKTRETCWVYWVG